MLKFQVTMSNSCQEIFDKILFRTDRHTHRQTHNGKTEYHPPLLRSGGLIKIMETYTLYNLTF